MLKMTGVEVEKMFDIDMNLLIEKGPRGGIFYIAKRYSEASNKFIKNCDPTKLSKFISYLDINNLYGWAMSGQLPYGGFKWLKNVDNFDVNSSSEKSPIGYVIKVNLEYPDEFHVLHSDCPLAPEKLAIPFDVSDYCKKIADICEIIVSDVKKLIPNLGNYVLHYRNLRLQLSLGMKQTKIHRVLKFKQSDWMKKYIDSYNEKKKKMLVIILKKTFLSR